MLRALSETNYTVAPLHLKNRPQTISDPISVIIPVLDGGEDLRKLLQKIRSQKKISNLEIIVIDSESTDDSVNIAREFGSKVISIERKEFNHGSTRNLGADEAKGDFLVYTVQDAVPVSDYWLYTMVCPFYEYPELSALSAKQFVKPEAEIFNLWENEMITVHQNDCIWSMSGNLDNNEWKCIDPSVKAILANFDDVVSCIRRSTFKDVQYRPLMFGEDMDLARQLIVKGRHIGFMASTGVFHWHTRGAAYVLRRHYIGTRSDLYIMENSLPYTFHKKNVGFDVLSENICGAYDLIRLSLKGLHSKDAEPLRVVKKYIGQLESYMQMSPDEFYRKLGTYDLIHEDDLDILLRQVTVDKEISPEKKYNFRQNILIPTFMERLGQFSEYLCSRHKTLKGREKEFDSCILKIFSMTVGGALGAYYLEFETLGVLTPELNEIDQLMGDGICFQGSDL